LIQSVSTTITSDIIKPIFGKFFPSDESKNTSTTILVNRIVIIAIGIISIFISYDQLINPNLSVGIFAQNGVYGYFSAAFVPILFGMFLKDATKASVISASVAAIVVHFSFFYGNIKVPFSIATGQNPGVAGAVAISVSIIVGGLVYFFTRKKANA